MKNERNDIDFPLWRKKVDSSLFEHKGSVLPLWACTMWGIQKQYGGCESSRAECSQVTIEFQDKAFNGWLTEQVKGRSNPQYRLWFDDDLLTLLKDTFLMSYMRDIERRLRGQKDGIEEEIPFWEFLDIEYDQDTKTFYFTAHYTQKPAFPELFKRLIGSPVIQSIDREVYGKGDTILPQGWKRKDEVEAELGAENVIYTLLDTANKLLYVGEAKKLVHRLRQKYSVIPHWDYFRYEKLPDNLAPYRVMIEEMLIRCFASVLENKKVALCMAISDYRLANLKIKDKSAKNAVG